MRKVSGNQVAIPTSSCREEGHGQELAPRSRIPDSQFRRGDVSKLAQGAREAPAGGRPQVRLPLNSLDRLLVLEVVCRRSGPTRWKARWSALVGPGGPARAWMGRREEDRRLKSVSTTTGAPWAMTATDERPMTGLSSREWREARVLMGGRTWPCTPSLRGTGAG
jgi:hypothetical protein